MHAPYSRLPQWILTLLPVLVSFSCSLQKPDPSSDLNASQSSSSMQVITHTLKNGLTVYLSPNHETPRFYAEIITRAGSKHDPETNTGLAHYLEHLLFKGTQSFGTIDYAKEKPLLDEMLEAHIKNKAEISIATIPVNGKDATSFGILKTNEKEAITSFIEKPAAELLP